MKKILQIMIIYLARNSLDLDIKYKTKLSFKIIPHPELCKRNIFSFYRYLWFYFYVYSSLLIISSSQYLQIKFKKKGIEIHLALNYFIPFKNDYTVYDIKKNSHDYVISTSLNSAFIDSVSSKININKYKILGFPRMITSKNLGIKKFILETINAPLIPKKLILYAPYS